MLVVCGARACARSALVGRARVPAAGQQRFLPARGRRALPARDPDPDLARHDHRPQRRAAGGVLAGRIDLGQSAGTAEDARPPARAGQGPGRAAGRADQPRQPARGQGIHLPQAPDQSGRGAGRSSPMASRACARSASSAASTRRAKRWRTCWASPTSTTAARKASNWRSTNGCAASPGAKSVIRDRRGRIVENVDLVRAGAAGQATSPSASTAASSTWPIANCATRC